MKRIITVGFLSLAVPLAASPAYAAAQERSPIVADMFGEDFPMGKIGGGSSDGVIERIKQNKPEEPEQSGTDESEPAADTGSAGQSSKGSTGSVSNDPSSTRTPAPASPAPVQSATGPVRTVSSTAYCLTGRMASGRPTYVGAAAMNGVPLGSRYRVLSGPASGRTFTVEDRIGWGSQFDIAYPGDCSSAIQYGRRTIRIAKL